MAFSPSEDTTCVNLKRDFNSFLSGTGPNRPSFNKRGLHFSLDECNKSSKSQQSTNISMQSLIEKDRQEKLKEAEIIAANNKITELKLKVSQLETSHAKVKIEFDTELGTVRQECQKEINKLTEYKDRWQYLVDKEKETKQLYHEVRKELEGCKSGYEQKISKLQRDKLQLEDDLHQNQESMRVKVMEMKNDLWRKSTELEICQSELEETKAQLTQQHKRCSEATAQMKELEDYKLKLLNAESNVKELEQKIHQFEDDSILVNSMKSQLAILPELEKEIRTLKDKNKYLSDKQENVALIDEQMKGLKSRLERADQRCADMAALQVENEALKNKIKKWELIDAENSKEISPVELKRQLAEAQNSQIALLEKQGQLQSRVHSLEYMLEGKSELHQSVSSSLTQESSRSQQQLDHIRRLQKKLLLVTKERDAFKRILDSYESEITVNIPNHTSSRLQQSEQLTEIYQKQLDQLEEELQKKSELLTQEKTRARKLELSLQEANNKTFPVEENQKSVRELRVKVAELESKLQTMEEEKFVLESRIEQRHLQGDYDPMKTKVVHFLMNPAAMAQKQRAEELGRLREENGKLKERIKVLVESEGKVADITMEVDKRVQANKADNVNELKAQVASAELKNKRLMEAFKKTSQEFREICYLLTGYKIDISNTNQYRLMSMYAESPDDVLLFQQSQSGEVQLLETEYSASLQSLIEVYLQKQDSIPGFLGALTLDLLARQTMRH